MGAPDILGRLAEAGVRLSADGDKLRAEPADRLTDELRSLIRANKPALLARLGGHARDAEALEERARPIPLTEAERSMLDRLARIWSMNEHDRTVMFRQCERGAELADGSWLPPEEAKVFWLAEAGAIH
jgi:hypothetical protein